MVSTRSHYRQYLLNEVLSLNAQEFLSSELELIASAPQ